MQKKWTNAPYDNLRVVQVYAGFGPLCETCRESRSKFLYATPDNRALDLCFACSEAAFSDGAISDRWHIDNYEMVCGSGGSLVVADWHRINWDRVKDRQEEIKREMEKSRSKKQTTSAR